MDRKEKIAWLSRYAEAEKEIELLIEALQRCVSKAQRITPTLSFLPKQKGNGSPVENAVEKIIGLQNEITAQLHAQQRFKLEIEKVINQIEKKEQRDVLRARYLCGQIVRFEEISQQLHYSCVHVRRLHGLGLKSVVIDS